MSEYRVDVTVTVVIAVRDGSDAIPRITGPDGDGWRDAMYDLHTEDDVLEHWAYNAVCNGVTDVGAHLDGWGDLPDGAVTMNLDRGTFHLLRAEAVG